MKKCLVICFLFLFIEFEMFIRQNIMVCVVGLGMWMWLLQCRLKGLMNGIVLFCNFRLVILCFNSLIFILFIGILLRVSFSLVCSWCRWVVKGLLIVICCLVVLCMVCIRLMLVVMLVCVQLVCICLYLLMWVNCCLIRLGSVSLLKKMLRNLLWVSVKMKLFSFLLFGLVWLLFWLCLLFGGCFILLLFWKWLLFGCIDCCMLFLLRWNCGLEIFLLGILIFFLFFRL